MRDLLRNVTVRIQPNYEVSGYLIKGSRRRESLGQADVGMTVIFSCDPERHRSRKGWRRTLEMFIISERWLRNSVDLQ